MNRKRYMFAIISLFFLAACGGGGGSAPGNSGGSSPAASTVISGVASKGLISNGNVIVFALNADGSTGTQLGRGTTDANGNYSVSIGTYSGPVLVEAYGGYTDEATGLAKTISSNSPLRAAFANVSSSVTIAVTPLTDLAVRQAGSLIPTNISAANGLVTELFKFDIIATMPVAPTASALSRTTQAQKDYTLALAAVSQLMTANGGDLNTTLETVESGMTSTGMSSQTAAAITTAASTFLASSQNQTGITDISDTSLQDAGTTTLKLSVALQGADAPSVKGVQATIILPAGLILRADSSGEPLAGVIAPSSGVIGGYLDGKYTPATATAPATITLGLINTKSLAAGDIIDITCDLVPGAAAPAAGAISISTSDLVDSDGNSVSGASLSII